MHPYLAQAIAAERTADFRRDAAASRRARHAVAASRTAKHPRGGQRMLSKSSVSRAA